MIASKPDLLDRAVTGRLAGTLSVPTDSRQQWNVRFLARDAVHDGIWIEPLGEAQSPLDSVIARGATVEIAICHNHNRHAFRTTIVRRNKHFWLTETMMFDALLLRGPFQLYPADRRAHVRYQIPDGSHIQAHLQCPGAYTPVRATPWDICPAGVAFLCPRESAITALKPNDPIGLKITHRGNTIAARSTVRFTRFITDRVIKTGVQLLPDSIDESSRRQLDSFLTDLQRLARPNPIRASR